MNLAQQIAARMLGAKKSVMGSVKSGAAGAPAAETGSKSERASGTQPRHLPTRALEPVPGFIRERNAEKRADPIQPPTPAPVPMAERRRRIAVGQARRNEPDPPRPVSTRLTAPTAAPGPRTITERPPALPPVPPRAELEFDLVRGLQALPLPAAAPASSAPAPAARGRGSCRAIDADTGRQCRLPAHPEDPDRHGNERGPFFRVLGDGQVPRLHQQLDEASMAARNVEVFAGASHVKGEGAVGTGPTRRGIVGTVERLRKSAHAGDSTSTGIKSIDTNPTPEASP